MDTQQKQDRAQVTYGLAASVFAVGGFLLHASGMSGLIAGACALIALASGWLALRSDGPLERKRITYGLAALAFVAAGFVLYSPGVSALVAGASVAIGVLLLWVALRGTD